MEKILTPPTDNLWKFMAISGMWGGIFILITYILLILSQAAMNRNSTVIDKVFWNDQEIDQIRNREVAIQQGRVNDDRTQWLYFGNSIPKEKEILANRIEYLKRENERLGASPKATAPLDLQMVEIKFLERFIGFCYVLLCVSIFGFLGWWKYVQLPSQRRMEIELQLLEIELKEKQK